MNLIPDIMEKLGVKEKEVFNIVNKEGEMIFSHENKSVCEYKFDDKKFWLKDAETEWRETPVGELAGLIAGVLTVKHSPFKPKKWEIYWYVTWCNGNDPIADCDKYLGNDMDDMRIATGNCFCTSEEAELYKQEIYEKYHVS